MDDLTLEQKAKAVGEDAVALQQELLSGWDVMFEKTQQRFVHRILDLKNKRIISDDGEMALQWKLRSEPDQPESEKNQQTSRGVVELVFVKPEDTKNKVRAFLLAESIQQRLNSKRQPTVEMMKQVVDFLNSL